MDKHSKKKLFANITDDEWIVCQSKSKCGRRYFFNKSTGESKWCESDPNSKKEETGLRPSMKSKTPAQDRLKRLQHRLQVELSEKNNKREIKTNVSKTERPPEISEMPSTSSAVKRTESTSAKKSPRKRSLPSEAEVSKKVSKWENQNGETTAEPAATTTAKSPPKAEQPSNNGIATMLTAIKSACKALATTLRPTQKAVFKPAKKTTGDSPLCKPLAMRQVLADFKALDERSGSSRKESTTENLITPSFGKNRANARLARLRSSLKSHSSPQLSNIDQSSTTASSIDDFESMDWQPIDNDKGIDEEQTQTLNTTAPLQAKETANETKRSLQECSTIGEYYDTVNENLLRMAAEKSSSSPKAKWLRDHYYFVVDTNVLLSYLAFVDNLRNMKLCDTSGSVVFLPYRVLQELDGLKMRSASESTKTFAVRAIKFLNVKFERGATNIQAQSAMDEREHLIDITSADDSIINCCLQVKAAVPQVLLLTEDVNLRNKAICNNILVSTKSNLISTHITSHSK